MNTNNTIELVGYGHPDRFADYIGEKILEELLAIDKNAKVAIEVLATRNSISLGGEVSFKYTEDDVEGDLIPGSDEWYSGIVYGAISTVYDGERWWPNYDEVKVYNHIALQSPELSKNQEEEIVAGDQGVVYGYYDQERFDLISELYSIMNRIKFNFDIANDWKLLFNLDSRELSMSVCGDVDHSKIKEFLETNYDTFNGNDITFVVNPKGTWLIPGPLADTGVVGRKLMIDTFGAGIPHGGGAFCGKDPSKVDKTGIIIASYLAKDAANYTGHDKVLVELNYKIGDKLPKAYAHYPNGETQDISNAVNLTLNEYIHTYGLLNEPWSKYVLKGGIISYLNRNGKN